MAEPRTPENIGQSLQGLRIADYYSSLLHVSGADISLLDNNIVYDGLGTTTGISLSSEGTRVTINNYIEPIGWDTGTTYDPISGTMEWLDAFFPINSIMLTTTNDNPGNRIAETKWVLQSSGKFLASVGTGQEVDWVDGAPVVRSPLEEYEFTRGSRGTRSGDLAGEYCVTLRNKNLPPHTHNVNMRSVTQTRDAADPSTVFCFYFGLTVNPQQITEEKRFSINSIDIPGVQDNPYSYFLDQDRIEAFQRNTSFTESDGTVIQKYRDHVITTLHDEGFTYDDSHFSPKLANYSLKGWGGAQAGGPGWGGAMILDDSSTVFIANSPRPVGVAWSDNTTILRESSYDPRDIDKVHPGTFGSEDLILARNIIISVLGIDEARKALANVNRLPALGETVDDYGSNNRFVIEEIESVSTIPTTNTGRTVCHNNIPPNYGVYFWRRVPLDFPEVPVVTRIPYVPGDPVVDVVNIDVVEDVDEPVVDTQDVVIDVIIEQVTWRAEIIANKKELDLSAWALDRGWNGISPATITVRAGVYIWSDNTTVPALKIDDFPGGLTLINNGYIMGRGGDGGSYAAVDRLHHPAPPPRPVPVEMTISSRTASIPGGLPEGAMEGMHRGGENSRVSVPPGGSIPYEDNTPWDERYTGWDGWNGGHAIEINTVTTIIINNNEGAIGGGGGGGAGGASGDHGGGGGGAGGGSGGLSYGGNNMEELGGPGGAVGEPGGDGANWRNTHSRDYEGWVWSNSRGAGGYQGRGGQAGGGGAGGREQSGNDPHGAGGGGGRVLSSDASGGLGGISSGGHGGSGGNPGESRVTGSRAAGVFVNHRSAKHWGNAAGGGGWGTDGGHIFRYIYTSRWPYTILESYTDRGIRSRGGTGGNAIKSVGGSNYTISGGLVYGKTE